MSLTQTQTSPFHTTLMNGFTHGTSTPTSTHMNGFSHGTSTPTSTSPGLHVHTHHTTSHVTRKSPRVITTSSSTSSTSHPTSPSTSTSFQLNMDSTETSFITSTLTLPTSTPFTASTSTSTSSPARSPMRRNGCHPTIVTSMSSSTTSSTTTPSSLTLLLQQQQQQQQQQSSSTYSSSSLSSTSSSHSTLSTSSSSDTDILSLIPISTSTLTSTMVTSTSTTTVPRQRQIARKTLYGLSDKAVNMINKTKESSSVMNFSINAINKLVTPAKSFTKNKLEAYGDPLLSYLDTKIDEAYNTVENTASYYLPERKHTMDEHDETSLTPYDTNDVDMEKSMSMLALREDDSKTVYQMYWDRVKEKFVHSKWYSKVDEILVQKTVKAFTAKVVSPAEFFYNAVSDEFVAHGTVDDFMIALKSRVGDQWDDRLKPLAKAFYTTAKAVSAVVGGARMVGTTLQQSKEKATNKVHNAIDDLLETWDKVLDLTDDVLDKWFPEKEGHPRLTAGDAMSPPRLMDARGKREIGSDMDEFELDGNEYDDEGDEFTSDGDGEMDGVFTMDEDGKEILSTDTSPDHPSRFKTGSSNRLVGLYSSDDDSVTDEIEFKRIHNTAQNEQALVEANTASTAVTKKRTWESHNNGSHRSVVPLAQKITKRLRQRIPSMRGVSDNLMGWAEDLKQNLVERAWFQSVDEILMQNMLVKALADIIRPAEHFFNTSLQLFQTKRTRHAIAAASTQNSPIEPAPLALPASSPPPIPIVVVDDFIENLKRALGASWDDRLIGLAKSFFTLAVKMKPQGVDVSDTSDTD